MWNLPNILTISRLGLTVVLCVLIHYARWTEGLVVFCVAALTDWLDGYLARKQGLTSAFGRNLDPLVDKLLICGAFIFLIPVPAAGLAPWMVMLVVSREIVVTGLRSFFEARQVSFGADFLGKLKMGTQCAAVIATLLLLALPADRRAGLDALQIGLVWAMLAATALSGLQYVVRALRLMSE
ncbi:MAG: CDP-diacylglycerol--glycerol-3-phosphate 3-phosphatidyltransferase [Gemmataceae bacterium]|nr:CDP-diacylglycerol--glycerol-3-phosphate 3-phosphatidyltransferase [Gemmataceae bacterium]